MTTNAGNEVDTAVTVFADDSIKELLKSGKIEDVQKIVQEGQSSLPATASCFSWSKGQIVRKYEIIRKIGKGGMGVIYLARHTQLDTLRALKVLPAESAEENPVFAERFTREARIASQIRHPNVVEVMDVETDPQLNVSYIVMEYVDGGSLRQILKGQSKLNIEQAIVTIQSVASALSVAAEHGIVHRDIKPDNIMFTKLGGVKLADLGIAKKDDEDDNLTKTNVMMGTPAYLSPEQVENPKAVDIRSDIYSLGATFYEMLTGQTPYPGKTSYDILRKIFSDPVPDPRSVNPEIPGEIASVVMKMIAKEPQKRYQTPAQLLEALAKIIPPLSDTNIQLIVKSIISIKGDSGSEYTSNNSVFTGTICKMRKRDRRKKVFVWAGCACLLLVLCGLIGTLFVKKTIPNRVVPHSIITETNDSVPESTEPAVQAVTHSLQIKTTPLATLRLTAENGQILTYAGNSNGEFNISGLTAGSYEVEISRPDYISYKNKHSIPTTGALRVLLRPDVRNIIVSGVAGTKLELQCPDGRERIFTVPVNGVIKIEKLKKGSYLLKSSHPEYISSEKRLVLENDLQISLQMEKMFKTFSLTTLPGSQVELLQNSQVKFVQKTGVAGKSIFSKVKRGVYELKITAPHYKTHSSILHIEKDTSITVPLAKSLYSVTVYGDAGITGEMFAGTRKIRKFAVSSSGYAVISGVEQGKYTLTFTRRGYVPQKQNIEVKENTSLQISLAEVPGRKTIESEVVAPSTGTLSIYLSASDDLLKFIQRKGIEIKINDGNWIKTKKFPLAFKQNIGENLICVRGDGILPQNNLSAQVMANKNTDFLLEIKAKPSTVVFSSNRIDAMFAVDDKIYPADEEILIKPFQEYIASSSSQGQSEEKKLFSSIPGEKLKIDFFFATNIHPKQKQYDEGMKLFNEKKYKEALPLLLSAAEAKHPDAVLQVAYIYEKGLGMWFSDNKKALQWYWKAAELNDPDAAIKIANAIYNGDYEANAKQMLDFYLLAVKNNNPEVTYKVALIYKNGFRDINPDDAKALQYLQKAAGLGLPEAMYDLGIRYEKGQGVPFNSKTSLFWIKKAADQGYGQAVKYWKQLNQ